MSSHVNEMVAKANEVVPKTSADETRRMMAEENALLVDVRDAAELQASGKAKDALHVPRGVLEFKADPESPSHEPAFDKSRPVIIYCAAGGRAALAGKALKDLGYEKVYNLGGFKDWVEGGGEIETLG